MFNLSHELDDVRLEEIALNARSEVPAGDQIKLALLSRINYLRQLDYHVLTARGLELGITDADILSRVPLVLKIVDIEFHFV